MAESRLFKRRLEPGESFGKPVVTKRDSRTEVLTDLASMSPAEKRAFVAGLPTDLKKALRNEMLLAQATATVPTADEGLFALVHLGPAGGSPRRESRAPRSPHAWLHRSAGARPGCPAPV